MVSLICPPLVLGSEVNSGQLWEEPHSQEQPQPSREPFLRKPEKCPSYSLPAPHGRCQQGGRAGSQALPLPGGGSAGGASPTSLLCGLEHTADLVNQGLCLPQRTHQITLTWLCCGQLLWPRRQGAAWLQNRARIPVVRHQLPVLPSTRQGRKLTVEAQPLVTKDRVTPDCNE